MKKFKWDNRYLYAGITAVLVIFCCIVFFMVIERWGAIKLGFYSIISVLTPFIWGLVIAYLLSPMMKFFQKNFFTSLSKKLAKKPRAQFAIARGFSIALSVFVAMIMIVSLLWLVLPRFYASIESIVLMASDYFLLANNMILDLLENFPELEASAQTFLNQLYDAFIGWITNDLQPQMKDIVNLVSNSIIAIIKAFFNIILGFIISCYVLYSKEKFGGALKRMLYSILSVEHVEAILKSTAFIDDVFMGFLGGKLLDSAIIGLICYFGCAILGVPYAVLIAVIVGVTNIIPYFGPFIGAIPSAFIIFMVSPVKCLLFLIFIVVLQQFDGNILGPKILGNSVGISGFWVMFSIIVGSGLFGVVGMLVGVPVFVVLSTGVNILVKNSLEKRGLPTETAKYTCIDHVDKETHEPVRNENPDIPIEIIEEQ